MLPPPPANPYLFPRGITHAQSPAQAFPPARNASDMAGALTDCLRAFGLLYLALQELFRITLLPFRGPYCSTAAATGVVTSRGQEPDQTLFCRPSSPGIRYGAKHCGRKRSLPCL